MTPTARNILSPRNKKIRRIIFYTLTMYTLFMLALSMQFFGESKETVSSVTLPYVAVHLDLKGAPPSLKYLNKLLGPMKKLGANALLIEYEDMFPYFGAIVNISSPYHYDRDQLTEFLITASKLGFEIIPLIQTFGHMEFALKLAQYEKLREVPMYPDVICPSRSDSMRLIQEMVAQVVNFHCQIVPMRYFHIGCDEVYNVNMCEDCRRRDLDKMEIFFHHVRSVRNMITDLSPGTKVLIWDDMLRGIKAKDWPKVQNMDNIELMYWDYSPRLKVNHSLLRFYHQHFQNIWVASAFKGADGKESIMPMFRNRVMNHYYWMKTITDYKFGGESKSFIFKGIALTGWSRYHNLAPICDLLPLSIPSLFANLILIQHFKHGVTFEPEVYASEFLFNSIVSSVMEDLSDELVCIYLDRVGDNFSQCQYELLNPLYFEMNKYISHIDNIVQKFANPNLEVYAKYGYSDVRSLADTLKSIENHLKVLNEHETDTRIFMQEIFDVNVCDEYLGFRSDMAVLLLNRRTKQMNEILSRRVWGRGRNVSVLH